MSRITLLNMDFATGALISIWLNVSRMVFITSCLYRKFRIHEPAIAAAFCFYLIATQIGQEYLADAGGILHAKALSSPPKLPVPD